MNSAQHLVFYLVLALSPLVNAQEASGAPPQKVAPLAAQKSLLKTAATREFNKPLYFDQINNGVILPPLELEYDLGTSGGSLLKIGNVSFSEKNFYFRLLPLGKTHSKIREVLSPAEADKYALVLAWPEKLLTHGNLEMISRTGTVLWSYSFTRDDRTQWQQRLADWRRALIKNGISEKSLQRAGIFGVQFALVDVQALKAPFWNQKESFRFCLSQTDGLNSTKMCSQRYGAKSSGNEVVMGKVRSEGLSPRALVQNEDAPLQNAIPVASDVPTSFFAELKTGESYEFITVPNKLELMDIADSKKPSVLRIVGYDTRPIGLSTLLNPDQYGPLTRMLGFEATIGDPRKFWAASLQREDAKIYLPGRVGGVFRQRFELSEIPRAQSRAFLHKRTPLGTYVDGIKLEGRKQPTALVSSEENFVVQDVQDPAHFSWHFKAIERGRINRSYLNVEVDGKTYRSFYEIYKGFPREVSGRFTGVHAAGEFIFLGEVAYNQWFEDMFGWTNYWLSRQRWGVSGKYFQSLNKLKVDAAGNTAPLSVMTLDLKYRAVPGLWGRDESIGGMLSYQNVTFDKMKAPMLGVGAFWARSMPKVFDDLFNIIPLMRYPKWVDMEFIYYVNSMNSSVKLNSSMSLNFHGKVLWTERYFGEAGFGIKRYGFADSSLNQKAELNTFYGTVGLGINF